MQKRLVTFIGIPDILTLCNLGCGLLAIGLALTDHNLVWTSLLLLLGLLFDIFDGIVARRLKRREDFGAELDSLADLVTFGVAPFVLLSAQYNEPWVMAILVLIPICGALRLARHNVVRKSLHGYLIGAPIDISALAVPALLIAKAPTTVLVFTVLLLCTLYVSAFRVKRPW